MSSDLEETLLWQIKRAGVEVPIQEHRFHPVRRWRLDFAWPDRKFAVECEGATWAGGRHTRGSGFAKDCEKYNTAAVDGWLILRFTKDQIESGWALELIEKVLANRGKR